MKKVVILIIMMVVIFSTVSICWGWLIYYKPAFRGRIIDAETKAPIEGAVVVVSYWKAYLVGGPGGPKSTILDVREALTNASGEFHIPSFVSFTPFSRKSFAEFVIYKPGYMYSVGPPFLHNAVLQEKFFSTDVIGQVGEIRDGQAYWKGVLGIVELERARDASLPSAPTGYRSDKLPLFFKAINEDRKRQGLGGEEK